MKVEPLAPIVTTPITTTLLRTALTTTILTRTIAPTMAHTTAPIMTTKTSSPVAMPLVATLTDKVFSKQNRLQQSICLFFGSK
jgi:hypothetical protein